MKKIYQFILGIVMAVLVYACADDTDDKVLLMCLPQAENGTTISVKASMPSDKRVSKVGIVQKENSLDMLSQWQDGDQVQMFASQDGTIVALGKSPVSDISSDGKTCTFSFQLPAEIDPEKAYYVFGFCGIDGTLENGVISLKAPMKRVPIASFKAPMYFTDKGSSTALKAGFMHLGAYEILHVANKSGSAIQFAHGGYDTDTPWYYSVLHNTYEFRSASSGMMLCSGTDGTPETESVTILNGDNASIVSWYAPNGGTVTNATLVADINASTVMSSNTKTSNTVIQKGRAYHLYAVWDGKALKFSNQDMQIEDGDNIPKDFQENYWDGTLKKAVSCKYKDKIITLYKKIDLNDYRTNPDGSMYYKTSLFLDISGEATIAITNKVYTSANLDYWQHPCMLIETDNDVIDIFSISKDEDYNYSMVGYVFRYDVKTQEMTKETVFQSANWGWYPRFAVSDNTLKLHHFSFAGYYAMESVRDNDGTWCTQELYCIYPDEYSQEAEKEQIVLSQNVGAQSNPAPEEYPVLGSLSDGLVAYYPFDTDANDYSGNGNNGTATNLIHEAGIKGNAYKFAGVDNPGWIQIPNSSSLQFDEAASFSMWFNVDSYRGQNGYANTVDYGCLKLFSKDYDRGEIHADLGGSADNKCRISFWGVVGGREGSWTDIEGSVLHQWHHAVFVATNQGLKIYLDGKLVNEKECNPNFSYSNSEDLWIGRMNSYYAYYFNGLIDEFRVYDRELNESEVKSLYCNKL